MGPTNYDTASNHNFESWRDADLYRAIDHPERTEPGPERDAEIEEYAQELRTRLAERQALAAREEELRSKYRIGG